MKWKVVLSELLAAEFEHLDPAVQDEFLATMMLLQEFGPHLERPHSGTLKMSKYKNMKELRFMAADRVWRAAYAFDRNRHAVILCIGSKSGMSEDRFYRALIARADLRFDEHVKRTKLTGKG
jgi:hypothetical protein